MIQEFLINIYVRWEDNQDFQLLIFCYKVQSDPYLTEMLILNLRSQRTEAHYSLSHILIMYLTIYFYILLNCIIEHCV